MIASILISILFVVGVYYAFDHNAMKYVPYPQTVSQCWKYVKIGMKTMYKCQNQLNQNQLSYDDIIDRSSFQFIQQYEPNFSKRYHVKNSNIVIASRCGKYLFGNEGHSIYMINLETNNKKTIVGALEDTGFIDGTIYESEFGLIVSMAISKDCNTLYVSDYSNNAIRIVDTRNGYTTTLKRFDSSPNYIQLSPDGNRLLVQIEGSIVMLMLTTGFTTEYENYYFSKFKFYLNSDLIALSKSGIWKLSSNHPTKCVLKGSFRNFIISKDCQSLFVIPNNQNNILEIVNIETLLTTTKHIINTNNIVTIDQGNTIVALSNDYIHTFDISTHNFDSKVFTMTQLSNYSFLSKNVINQI